MKMLLWFLVLAAALSACQSAVAPYDTGCEFAPEIGKCPMSDGSGGGGGM
jgi:hypothetical protein